MKTFLHSGYALWLCLASMFAFTACSEEEETLPDNVANPAVTLEVAKDLVVGDMNAIGGSVNSKQITKVVFTFNGIKVTETTPAKDGKFLTYIAMPKPGENKKFSAVGFDLTGKELAKSELTVTARRLVPYIDKVPYDYQWDNAPATVADSYPYSVMAMLLNMYYDKPSSADELALWGTLFDTPEKFAKYFGMDMDYAFNNNQQSKVKYTMQAIKGNYVGLKDLIDDNNPTPVNVNFSPKGHMVLVVGYDKDFYYCHDPAGKWDEKVGSGNFTKDPLAGKYVKYAKAAFEAAAGADGQVQYYKVIK